MKPPSNLVFTIIPWSLYFLGRMSGHPAWGDLGAMASMATARLMGWYQFRSTDWTQLTFFSLLLIGVYWLKNAWMIKYQSLLAPCCFALLSIGSLLVRQPFTAEYAREVIPEQFWSDPIFPRHFARVNTILTIGWGMTFGLALVCALGQLAHPEIPGWLLLAPSWIGFILIFLGTRYFPYWYQREIYAKESSLFASFK